MAKSYPAACSFAGSYVSASAPNEIASPFQLLMAITAQWIPLSSAILLVFIGQNASPYIRCSPNTGAHAFQLDNLTVIDKKVHLRPIILDVPGENVWIRGLKHYFFNAKCSDDPGNYIRPPRLDIFRDPFGFNHDQVGAGIEEPLGEPDGPFRIASPCSLKVLNACCASGPKLNANFRLWLK